MVVLKYSWYMEGLVKTFAPSLYLLKIINNKGGGEEGRRRNSL